MSDVLEFRIDDSPLTLSDLGATWRRPIRPVVSDSVWHRVEQGAATVQRIADSGDAAYGINTGFGHLCRERIAPDQLATLQRNLILSHAVGVGEPIAPDLCRWMMLLKIVACSKGVSGVARSTLELLSKMLEADLLPVIPSQGSLGASGDLAPLAHMVLPMIGCGKATLDGKLMTGGEALRKCGLTPVTLGPKEGLALINGTQFMAAHAAAIVVRARKLVTQADILATMSLEALMGSTAPFDARLHDLRPHPGAIESADNVRRLMVGSAIRKSHVDCDRVQDPYSLRCIPQVHGASRDAIRHAAEVVEREINSVTDNPIVLDDHTVISGGLFHGQPLALVLDYLAIALSELASISERRIYLLLSGVEGLPVLLMQETGINSGFMVPHYTAAALVSENKGLSTPASVDSIPTSLGQEDHVSMGARSAVKCMQILQNVETVLAIEQLCAAQGVEFRQPLAPGEGVAAALDRIRRDIAFADTDREFGIDIQQSLELLRSDDVLRSVEKVTGTLH